MTLALVRLCEPEDWNRSDCLHNPIDFGRGIRSRLRRDEKHHGHASGRVNDRTNGNKTVIPPIDSFAKLAQGVSCSRWSYTAATSLCSPICSSELTDDPPKQSP